jgi:hypothetical protein
MGGMAIPQSWRGEAFNQSRESENRIHSDQVAREYGFKGGLVPGVTVSAYLIHPGVEAWGLDWLARGRASVVVGSPLYDGRPFRVEVSDATERSYRAVLFDEENAECATASVELLESVPPPPKLRGDPRIEEGYERPPGTRDVMEGLRERGMRALRARWDGKAGVPSYLRDPAGMPEVLRADGGGYANPANTLGITNWALGANVKISPWLHLQTDSQNFAPIPLGSDLVAESSIADLFEKKGHEFVDLDVALYLESTGEAVMSARLRAIYKMRGL